MAGIEFCLLDIDYVLKDGKPIVRLWGKTKNGKNVLAIDRDFKPYFYVELSEKHANNDGVERIKRRIGELKDIKGTDKLELVEKKLLGEKKTFLKIMLQNPTDIQKLRRIVEDWEGIRKPYEYDITLYKRYLIDRGLTPLEWVSVSGKEIKTVSRVDRALEISEVRPSGGTHPKLNTLAIDIEISDDKIIMISLVSKNFKKALTYGWGEKKAAGTEMLKDEKGMIKRFVELIGEKNPDIIVTYNGDLFDFVKLRSRAGHYKMDLAIGRDKSNLTYTKRGRIYSAKITGRVHVDLYDFIEHILSDTLQSETLTLDMVSREILGKGKRPIKWKDIEEMWKKKTNLNKLADYCKWDSVLALKLSERLIPQIFELCRLTGQTLFDTTRLTYSQLVEWLLIKRAHERNEIVLNRPKYDEIKRRREASPYTGGYVYTPKTGIHENIALFDFASLYPSTVITHNISPETLDKDPEESKEKNSVPGEDHFFSLKREGFIKSVLEDLVKRRIEIKKKMESLGKESPGYRDLHNRQYALKILANASYGYYAYAGSRWYSRICAKSIAAWGRYYIQKVIKKAEDMNLKVIYGDTDSLFLADCREQKVKGFLGEVNKDLPETMELEFEGLYKSGIFVPTKVGTTAKKRYALLDQENKITIRGFEKVRRDWCKIAKDTQEKVLLAILKDRDQDKAVNTVEETIERLKKGEVDKKELVIYTQITRPIERYEQIGPHVSAAKKYVARGHTIKEGSVIGYIITKGAGSISNRAEPFEYADNYDPEYYINNQIIPAAMRILHGLGFTQEDVLSEPPGQRSLDTFMKKSISKKLKEKWGKFRKE
ncbi:MAG: DNA polymerase [Candidatus Aenigmarchaeota archaeon]|nr:DNA polymerase [Candidatus Aenigmarchaeota archaeon]NIP40173.1 DNA polymerase [Candidatus Aenigmarchaeota archaeon]NIQ17217.1 DNA polymerase [Candidatus Aenigmarchaeota archaeon]NIS73007.1 DNA polymerase [Candidatus Aenigmarchaeota archaeon]